MSNERIAEITARWQHPQWGAKYKEIALQAESDIPYLLSQLAAKDAEIERLSQLAMMRFDGENPYLWQWRGEAGKEKAE